MTTPYGSFWKGRLNRGQLQRCAFRRSKRLRRHSLTGQSSTLCSCLCYDECSWGHKMPAARSRAWLAMLTRQLYNLLTSETPHHPTLVLEPHP